MSEPEGHEPEPAVTQPPKDLREQGCKAGSMSSNAVFQKMFRYVECGRQSAFR
jgi:hypothetical protein